MTQSMYPQPWSVATPSQPPPPTGSWQWLAAGIAGIAGGFVVASTVAGQVTYLLSGRSGLRIEQGALILAQLVFGVGVVLAAYLLAPGPVPVRLVGAGLFLGGVIITVVLGALRLSGSLRGGVVSASLLNPYGLLLLAGAVGWLLAARARPLSYLALVPVIGVFPMSSLLIRAGLPPTLATTATLGVSLLIALGVLAASKPRPA